MVSSGWIAAVILQSVTNPLLPGQPSYWPGLSMVLSIAFTAFLVWKSGGQPMKARIIALFGVFYLLTIPLAGQIRFIPLIAMWWLLAVIPLWYAYLAIIPTIRHATTRQLAGMWIGAGLVAIALTVLVHTLAGQVWFIETGCLAGLFVWGQVLKYPQEATFPSHQSPAATSPTKVAGGGVMLLALVTASHLILTHQAVSNIAILPAILIVGPIIIWMRHLGYLRYVSYAGCSLLGVAYTLDRILSPMLSPMLSTILLVIAAALLLTWAFSNFSALRPQWAWPYRIASCSVIALLILGLEWATQTILTARIIDALPLIFLFIAIPLLPHPSGHALTDQSRTVPEPKPEEWLARFPLTQQEQRITLMLLQGYSNQEILGELYISINTLKTHLRNIYRKTDTKNRRDLYSQFAPRSTVQRAYSYTHKSG